MYGREVWECFKLPGSPPEPMGVFANQPSPVTINVAGIWAAFAAFAIFLLVLMAGFDIRAKKDQVFAQSYQFNRSESKSEASFVTDVFELSGRTSTVQVKTHASI